jgi:hypothetical protein
MKIINHLESVHYKNHIIYHLILSVLFGIVFTTMAFGTVHIHPSKLMGWTFYYNVDDFYMSLANLGQEGRISYLFFHLFDYLFIMHFYPLLIFFCVALFKRLQVNTVVKSLSLLPVFPWLLDFLENLFVDISLLNYPVRIQVLGELSGVFSCAKWIFLWSVCILLGVLVILSFSRKRRAY